MSGCDCGSVSNYDGSAVPGLAIMKCLDMLNPNITVEARGELILMIRELAQLNMLTTGLKDQVRNLGIGIK